MPNIGCCCGSFIWVPLVEGRGYQSSGLATQQRLELAGTVEGRQIVESADVNLADVDLRHGAPAGLFHHLAEPRRFEVDADFLDLGDAPGLEQHFGALAVRADAGAVHADLGHKNLFHNMRGYPPRGLSPLPSSGTEEGGSRPSGRLPSCSPKLARCKIHLATGLCAFISAPAGPPVAKPQSRRP